MLLMMAATASAFPGSAPTVRRQAMAEEICDADSSHGRASNARMASSITSAIQMDAMATSWAKRILLRPRMNRSAGPTPGSACWKQPRRRSLRLPALCAHSAHLAAPAPRQRATRGASCPAASRCPQLRASLKGKHDGQMLKTHVLISSGPKHAKALDPDRCPKRGARGKHACNGNLAALHHLLSQRAYASGCASRACPKRSPNVCSPPPLATMTQRCSHRSALE